MKTVCLAFAVLLSAANVRAQPASTISPTWDKPTPVTTALNPQCGPDGAGGDAATNHLKNRTDEAASYHEVLFAAVTALNPSTGLPKSRAQWTSAQRASIQRYEGVPVRIIGYLAGVRVENAQASPHGESSNCNLTDDADVDWHVWLVATPSAAKAKSVVVETTPRVRKHHPSWSSAKLQQIATSHEKVRVSGWLMYDPEHAEQVSGTHPTRSTLWEVHPVTQIEVFRGGAWKNLDQN